MVGNSGGYKHTIDLATDTLCNYTLNIISDDEKINKEIKIK